MAIPKKMIIQVANNIFNYRTKPEKFYLEHIIRELEELCVTAHRLGKLTEKERIKEKLGLG